MRRRRGERPRVGWRWTPGAELAAWGRAVRAVTLTLVGLAVALVVLRVAGGRGLLVTAAVTVLVVWLARLGQPRR